MCLVHLKETVPYIIVWDINEIPQCYSIWTAGYEQNTFLTLQKNWIGILLEYNLTVLILTALFVLLS